MVVLLRLAACSTSLLIGLTSRCFVPQFAIVALLRYRLQVSFAHWTSASPVSRTARGEAPSHRARASCAPRHCHIHNSQWSRRCAHRLACDSPLLIGLTTACFRHRRRPSCAPLQFPLKSCGFPGAETARKRFLLWKMGFSDAAYCEPMPPSIQHGRPTPSHRPALTLARCSAPADFASLRVLEAPAASRPPTLASSLVALPASLGLLRAVSPTGRALRAPPPYTPPGTIEVR